MKAVVITRDRVGYARQCVTSLIRSGIAEIHLVDHESTYPPMLDWLSTCDGQVTVHSLPNAHPRDIWSNGTLDFIVGRGRRFLVTDCDVVAPTDVPWLSLLEALLEAHPWAVKAGLGLRTDDLPEHFSLRDQVIGHEATYQRCVCAVEPESYRHTGACELALHGVSYHRASIDTTLAVYRELGRFDLDPALRTGSLDYCARHLPWYENDAVVSEELAHYQRHAAKGVSHWLDPDNYVWTHGLL